MKKPYPRITVYVRPSCPSWWLAKRWLDQRGIAYTEIDISKDEAAARYVETLNNGYRSVPTFLFDGSHVATEPSIADLERLLA
jgi:mycoredoxin